MFTPAPGDTVVNVAQRAYGDAGLAGALARALGLEPDAALTPGSAARLPDAQALQATPSSSVDKDVRAPSNAAESDALKRFVAPAPSSDFNEENSVVSDFKARRMAGGLATPDVLKRAEARRKTKSNVDLSPLRGDRSALDGVASRADGKLQENHGVLIEHAATSLEGIGGATPAASEGDLIARSIVQDDVLGGALHKRESHALQDGGNRVVERSGELRTGRDRLDVSGRSTATVESGDGKQSVELGGNLSATGGAFSTNAEVARARTTDGGEARLAAGVSLSRDNVGGRIESRTTGKSGDGVVSQADRVEVDLSRAAAERSHEVSTEDGDKRATRYGGEVSLTTGALKGEHVNEQVDVSDGGTRSSTSRAGAEVDLSSGRVAASYGQDRREEQVTEDGKRVNTTGASGTVDVANLSLSGQASTGSRTERTVDGEKRVGEQQTTFSLDSQKADVGVEHRRTDASEKDGRKVSVTQRAQASVKSGLSYAREVRTADASTARGTIRGGKVGLEASGTLAVEGRRQDVATEKDAQGNTQQVTTGLSGNAQVRRDSLNAEIKRASSDGQANVVSHGGGVKINRTGAEVFGSREHQNADGNLERRTAGLKAGNGQVGVTTERATTVKNADGSEEQKATGVELMVGKEQASARLTRSRTTSRVDSESGQVVQDTRSVGVHGSVRAHQSLNVLGEVKGGPEALRGKHAVEVRKVLGGSLGVDGGMRTPTLGLQGSLTVSRDAETVYRTHVDAERAAALGKQAGQAGLADKVVGASLLNPLVEVPPMDRPDRLQVGDRITTTVDGSVTAGVEVEANLLRAGVRATVEGRFRMDVEKTGEHTMELEVTPTRVAGVRVHGGALAAETAVAGKTASQTSQRFEFNLSTEGGRRAYQDALQGKLPGGLDGGDLKADAHNLHRLQQQLPEGVTRLRTQRIESRQVSAEAKAEWLFMKKGASTTRGRTDEMVSDGVRTTNVHERSLERRKDTLLTGTESEGIHARLSRTTNLGDDGEPITRFDSITLEARFSDSKIKGAEYQQDVVDRLNGELGAGLSASTLKGNKESRDVSARVQFNGEDLRRMARSDGAQLETRARGLAERMKAAGSDVERSRVLQEHVQRHGLSGMGDALRLSGRKDALQVTTTSSAYEGSLATVESIKSRHRAPVSGMMSKAELTARFKEADDARDAVVDGRKRLADDPVYKLHANAAQREALDGKLATARKDLRPVTDLKHLSHDDALALHQKLDRGWTTRRQAGIQKQLEGQTGIKVTRTGVGRAEASSRRVELDGAVVSTRSVAEQKFLPLFGDERTSISASTRRVAGPDGRTDVESVTIRTRMFDEQSRGGEVNSDMVRPLNKAFGATFRESDVRGAGKTREVEVTRTIDGAALDRLGTRKAPEIARAVVQAGGSPRAAEGLVQDLAQAKTRSSRARVVENFVRNEGLVGAGAIHRLTSEGDGGLSVRSRSGAIEDGLQGARSVAEKHAAPITDGAKPADVAGRFQAVADAKKDLENTRARIKNDPFLSSTERAAKLKEADETGRALERSLDMSGLSHDGAVKLTSALERGWTTRHEQAAIDRIRKDAGVVAARGDAGESRRVSSDGGVVRERSRETVSRNPLSSGRERGQVRSSVTTARDGSVAGLSITARLSDSKVTGDELQTETVDRLNKAFGTRLDARGAVGDGKGRTTTVQLDLGAPELRTLARVPTGSALKIARDGPLPQGEVLKLAGGLASDKDDAARARRIQDFVDRHGVDGMGVVHRLAGRSVAPAITSEAEGPRASLAAVDDVISLYDGQPLHADLSKRELTERFGRVERARSELAQARQAITTDPFLSTEDRQRQLAELDARQRRLTAAVDDRALSAADRRALAARLQRGWTTRQQAQIVEQLRA